MSHYWPAPIALLAALVVGGCGGNAPPAPVPARLLEDPGFVAAGDLELHYGFVPAGELPVDLAMTYGINRSQDRVIVNVSVLRRRAGALPLPIDAEVDGSWRTLVGEAQPLAFRPVLEGGAVSYIAELPAANQGPITLELRARPPQGVEMTARLTREFRTASR
jgi:hypothetical protein